MVGHLCLSIMSSGASGDKAAPQPIPKLNIPAGDTSQSRDEKAAKAEVSSSDSQTDGGAADQATETSERKTLLIR